MTRAVAAIGFPWLSHRTVAEVDRMNAVFAAEFSTISTLQTWRSLTEDEREEAVRIIVTHHEARA